MDLFLPFAEKLSDAFGPWMRVMVANVVKHVTAHGSQPDRETLAWLSPFLGTDDDPEV